MDFLTDPYIIANLSKVTSTFLIAFVFAIILTPLAGYIAKKIGAVDLGANLRKKTDKTRASRNHTGVKLRLGGLAMSAALILTLAVTSRLSDLGPGIFLGIIIITITGFLEDKFEISGKIQIVGQILAAVAVVLSGISVTQISILGQTIAFDQFKAVISFGNIMYNMVFPADLLTVLWIVGIINVINWVGGIDGLNISISSIIAFTMMIFALNDTNVALAVIIAAFIGSNLGVFPFNYNPSKIFPGGIGDYLNGFMLGVFAIIGGTTWNSTLVLLGLPLIDALLVVYLRFKTNPELLRRPLDILSVSDHNHLQHRLLEVGYSRKMVLLIEVAIMALISTIAIYFTSLREERFEVILFATGFTIVLIIFTFINLARQRANRAKDSLMLRNRLEQRNQPVVKVIVKDNPEDDKDDYERFIY